MERDDVRDAWDSFEAQLKQSSQLSDLILVESLTSKARTPLTGERRFVLAETAVNSIVLVALGSFAFDHAATAAGICAAILAGALIAIDAVLIGVALALSRIDFDTPVLAVQAELGRIKARRAALTAGILIVSPLLWTPLLVLGLGIFGIDAVSTLGIAYLAANAAFGLLVGAAAWLTVRLFGRHLRTSPWTERAVDALTGRAYREAAEYLDTIERYRDG
jgi:hypothetical protein